MRFAVQQVDGGFHLYYMRKGQLTPLPLLGPDGSPEVFETKEAAREVIIRMKAIEQPV